MLTRSIQGHCHAASSTAAGSVDTVTASATATSCVAHGDHWHCPPGVSKPATSPAQTQTQTQTQSGAKPTTTEADHDHDHDHHGTDKECTPHGDHWHCPSGISAPTFPPTAVPSTSAAKSSGATSAGAATTTAAAKALAGGRPTVSVGSVGAAIAASLAGAFLFGTMLV